MVRPTSLLASTTSRTWCSSTAAPSLAATWSSAAVSSRVAPPTSTPPSTPSTRRRRTTSTVSGRRSCSATAGRLVVANDVGAPINVQFNKRYVAANDPGAAPSADVSIMSVNGQLGVDGITGETSVHPGRARGSVVARRSGDRPGPPRLRATTQKYLPSTLVPPPAPTVPDPPTNVVVTGHLLSMQVSWTAPVNNGGSQITRYTVRVASPVGNTSTCETVSATMCVVTGLLRRSRTYTFTVEATNDRRHLGAVGSVTRPADGDPPTADMGRGARCPSSRPDADHRLRTDDRHPGRGARARLRVDPAGTAQGREPERS